MKLSKRSLITGIIGISSLILGFVIEALLGKYYFQLAPGLVKLTYSTKDKLVFNIPTVLYALGLIFGFLSMHYQMKDRSDI